MRKQFLIGTVLAATLVWQGCSHSDSASNHSGSRFISSVAPDPTTPWAYDPGPIPQTPMGKELIDIVAAQPYMPGISKELTGDQKFRPAFGPTLWRMLQEPNSIKILFIGQDGTHIAEAAGRTATAGFGGRAQDMAAHFGVENSAAFINTFAFTIRGQYSGYGAPVVTEVNGTKKVSYESVVDNGVWLMAQDQNSPMVKWRNSLIDWIIRNNKDSLKLIVLFGGSAQDSIGTFIESRGGQVGSKYTVESLAERKVKVPLVRSVSAGGNRELPVAVDRNEQDIFRSLGHNVPYSDLGSRDAARMANAEAKLQEAKKALSEQIERVYPQLAISNGGLQGSGILHPAQIGGYDLTKIYVNDKKTISLKGLRLSDGSSVGQDLLVAEFPHPTALSSGSTTAAEAKVERSLALLKPYVRNGWEIQPDQGQTNKFSAGEAYRYRRADIGPAYYDFGTPNNRMVSVSSASRMTGNPNVVIIGTRDKATFDRARIQAATRATPAAGISTDEMFSARPRTTETRYVFDLGPGDKMARIMKENLNIAEVGKMKNGKNASPACRTPEKISEFNVKTHPLCVGDFGHYRGTFSNPKVVILADPDGVDDILTSRALTGSRGQYLHGLMQDMGVNDQYLVIKTVPFGMDGATDAEWNTVITQTRQYRDKIFAEILRDGKVVLVLADGKYASQEATRILGTNSGVSLVSINRNGSDNNSGLREAAAQINQLRKFNSFTAGLKMANIPRSHLGFFSRVWEGTSGTRVLDSTDPDNKGSAFAIIVPSWAYNQKNVVQSRDERMGINTLKSTLEQNRLPREDEKFNEFLRRRGNNDTRLEIPCTELCAHAS